MQYIRKFFASWMKGSRQRSSSQFLVVRPAGWAMWGQLPWAGYWLSRGLPRGAWMPPACSGLVLDEQKNPGKIWPHKLVTLPKKSCSLGKPPICIEIRDPRPEIRRFVTETEIKIWPPIWGLLRSSFSCHRDWYEVTFNCRYVKNLKITPTEGLKTIFRTSYLWIAGTSKM